MANWQNIVRLSFFYTLTVFVIEYLVIYCRFLSYRITKNNDHITIDHKTPILNRSQIFEFLSAAGNRSGARSLELVHVTRDWSKLHMVQLRLSSCVQRSGDVLKCLEDAYRSERRDEILKRASEERAKLKVAGQLAGIPQKRQAPVQPTDDPKRVDEFYSRERYREKVNEYKYDYLLTPNRTCDNETFMVILVHSFHPYGDRRTAIRSTWGGAATGRHPWPRATIDKKMSLFFVLGIHPLVAMNSAVQKESQQYGDILQGNFFDAYVNMTLKSLLGLKYVSTYCSRANYLLKSDDDMIINIPYLLKLLDEKKVNRSVMGPLNKGSRVYRAGKWKVTTDAFPFRYYPPYESGAAYVMTNDVVPELYNLSHYVRHFHVDDAYITGVLGKIIGIHHRAQKGFAFWSDKPPIACDIEENVKVTGTKMTPRKLEEIWNALKRGPSCRRRGSG